MLWKSIIRRILKEVAPLSRMLLALIDRIRLSMRLERNSSGTTTNPIGCGNSFIATPFFDSWAGARQGREVTFYDKGLEKVPKSSPHFVAYMINFTRPFIWIGETDRDIELVGWYSDPLQVYDKFHKGIIKQLSPSFHNFKSGRDLKTVKIWLLLVFGEGV